MIYLWLLIKNSILCRFSVRTSKPLALIYKSIWALSDPDHFLKLCLAPGLSASSLTSALNQHSLMVVFISVNKFAKKCPWLYHPISPGQQSHPHTCHFWNWHF